MLKDDDIRAVHELHEAYQQITHELGKVIVGQEQVIEQLLIAMFARGHCLLVGVPGLAKTLLIRSVADALSTFMSKSEHLALVTDPLGVVSGLVTLEDLIETALAQHFRRETGDVVRSPYHKTRCGFLLHPGRFGQFQ